MAKTIKKIGFFFRADNKLAPVWKAKITGHLKARKFNFLLDDKKPEALFVLGGDGTILEAARKFERSSPLLVGLNLGTVGFLASARDPKSFLRAAEMVLRGEYRTTKRLMVSAVVVRNKKILLKTNALNDVTVINPIGMVEIEATIDAYPFQYIRGTGALVSTATGSTAFNLSAHGPIVMPDIKCMVLSELLDHNIPTPSVVIRRNRTLELKIKSFRERNLLKLASTGEPADVILLSDNEPVCILKKGDVIRVSRSPRLIKFAELEKNYFLKSLKQKFSFE